MADPESLFDTIFFTTGKILCLRGGREHHDLKLFQFTVSSEFVDGVETEFVLYVENGSKNHSGSYKDKGENKIIKQYADVSQGNHCYVYLFNLYLSKLPNTAFEKDIFYLRPKQVFPLWT